MQKLRNKLKAVTLLTLFIFLAGCTATQTMISKREMDVQTKMSDTVFMDPLPPQKRMVYVQVTNTSDKPDFDIKSQVANAISSKGYNVTEDPEKAYVWLQANILSVGKSDLRESRDALERGYGGALSGAATGAALGSFSNSNNGMMGAGLIGGAVGLLADSLIKDINYSAIVDIRVSEKTQAKVSEKTRSAFSQGKSGKMTQAFDETTNWKKVETRILANANQVNLKFEDASPMLVAGVTRSISGMFSS